MSRRIAEEPRDGCTCLAERHSAVLPVQASYSVSLTTPSMSSYPASTTAQLAPVVRSAAPHAQAANRATDDLLVVGLVATALVAPAQHRAAEAEQEALRAAARAAALRRRYTLD